LIIDRLRLLPHFVGQHSRDGRRHDRMRTGCRG
jgi:hypothetical protein